MAKSKKEEISSQFSPLARCLVIDSSHRSRTELFKRIRACDLFENVMEAGSVIDAGRSLEFLDFDACIIGPSMSLSLGTEFITQYKLKSKASDCAFVAIVKQETDYSGFLVGAHQVFTLPPSTRVLFESLVKAILIASAGSKWPGVKLSDSGDILLLENGIWKVLDEGREEDQGETDAETDALIETGEVQLASDFKLSGDRDSILKFCEAIPKTPKDRIEKVILGLLTDKDSSTDPFVPFFIAAIKEWKTDITFMNLKEATHELKSRLLSFADNKSKQESANLS